MKTLRPESSGLTIFAASLEERERERLHTEIPIFQKETRRRRRRRESLFIAPVLSRAGLNYSAGTRVGGSVREFPSDVFLDDFIN